MKVYRYRMMNFDLISAQDHPNILNPSIPASDLPIRRSKGLIPAGLLRFGKSPAMHSPKCTKPSHPKRNKLKLSDRI